jgi:hypothetical protein
MMGGRDEDAGEEPHIRRTKNFGETYAEVTAWVVPTSDRYLRD